MRIECPSCGAVYEVPPERLAPGRLVRCAACSVSWAPLDAAPQPEGKPEPGTEAPPPVAEAPPPISVAEVPPPIPVAAAPEPPVLFAGTPGAVISEPPRAPVGSGRLALAGWVLTLVILVATGWGVVARRADIMHAWPNAERAYAVVGLGRAAP